MDYCEGHDACGANGFCKSNVKAGSFECKCHIFYQGQFCHECRNYEAIIRSRYKEFLLRLEKCRLPWAFFENIKKFCWFRVTIKNDDTCKENTKKY